MVSSLLGHLQEFNPDLESVSAYRKRTKLYFTANNIEDAGKQVAVFLSVVGVRTYSLLPNLTALALPQEKSFEDISATLKAHFEPKPLVVAERFHFY